MYIHCTKKYFICQVYETLPLLVGIREDPHSMHIITCIKEIGLNKLYFLKRITIGLAHPHHFRKLLVHNPDLGSEVVLHQELHKISANKPASSKNKDLHNYELLHDINYVIPYNSSSSIQTRQHSHKVCYSHVKGDGMMPQIDNCLLSMICTCNTEKISNHQTRFEVLRDPKCSALLGQLLVVPMCRCFHH